MRRHLWFTSLLFLSLPSFAADCILYKDMDLGGERLELTAPAQSYELTGGFNDVTSSVWIREGFYTLLTQDYRFQGNRIYLYGSGMSFVSSQWQFNKGSAATGGTWYNLVPLAFNDLTTSVLCLKL